MGNRLHVTDFGKIGLKIGEGGVSGSICSPLKISNLLELIMSLLVFKLWSLNNNHEYNVHGCQSMNSCVG